MGFLKSKMWVLSTLVLAIVVGYLLVTIQTTHALGTETHPLEESLRLPSSQLIDPLLACPPSHHLSPSEADLKQKLNGLLEKAIASKNIQTVSLQYYNLTTLASFTFNDDENYQPASLLKTAILVTVLEKAMEDPKLLEKTYRYIQRDPDLIKQYPSEKTLENEKTYTIKELLIYMIVYSDNRAKMALSEVFGTPAKLATMKALKLGLKFEEGLGFLRVSHFTHIFQALYNATYLNKEYSQMALDLLSRTTFNKGLRAGVPSDIVVAHKFAERIAPSYFGLHDCGIIYAPGKPYLLCIMTKGDHWKTQEEIIAEISRLTFTSVGNSP